MAGMELTQSFGVGQTQQLAQTTLLTQEMQQGLRFLQCPLQLLATELRHEMEQNYVIEEVIEPKEFAQNLMIPDDHCDGSISEKALDFSDAHAQETLMADDADRDVFMQRMENFEYAAENGIVNPDADEKRNHLFERQVKNENLQDHLLKQIPFMDATDEEKNLAEVLVGSIDEKGWFAGSLPDIQMFTGVKEKILLALLRKISQFDPLGCGGRNLRETLLYQMEKLDDSPWEDEVRAFVERHLDNFAQNKRDAICKDLKISPEELDCVVKEMRRNLDPCPGRNFSNEATPAICVVPEVFASRTKNGKWVVRVSERNLPDIRISPQYLKMVEDHRLSAEVRAQIRQKIEGALLLRDAIANRQETIRKIAQAIVDVQSEVFERKSLKFLKPLTEDQVAKVVDVHNATVSRTVNGKYMSTPLGIIEMRKFFVTGLKTKDGESTVANTAVKERIRELVDQEDKRKPLSDQKICDLLKQENVSVARRTVAKYRDELKIPGTSERRQT